MSEEISNQEINDIAMARDILKSIVVFNEETLTEDSNLNRIGTYTIQQAKQAFNLVADEILQQNPTEPHVYEDIHNKKVENYAIEKAHDEAHKMLSVLKKAGSNMPEELKLYIWVKNSDKRSISFSLVTGILRPAQSASVFEDSRPFVSLKTVSASELSSDKSLKQYKDLWRGLRWLSANLLAWNTGFVLPEELS